MMCPFRDVRCPIYKEPFFADKIDCKTHSLVLLPPHCFKDWLCLWQITFLISFRKNSEMYNMCLEGITWLRKRGVTQVRGINFFQSYDFPPKEEDVLPNTGPQSENRFLGSKVFLNATKHLLLHPFICPQHSYCTCYYTHNMKHCSPVFSSYQSISRFHIKQFCNPKTRRT